MTHTQYRAECACCAREHAVKGEALVHHGYKVPTGWHKFVGTCAGAGRAHFGTPEGRDYRAALANAFYKRAQDTENTATMCAAGTGEVRKWMRDPEGRRDRRGMVPWGYYVVSPATDYQRREWVEHLRHDAQRTRHDADEMQRTVDSWAQREPRAVVLESKPATVARIQRQQPTNGT